MLANGKSVEYSVGDNIEIQKSSEEVKYIPREDLQKLLLQGYVEAECENCGTEYRIEKEELEKIVKEITEMNISCDTSLCSTCDIGCFD